MTIIYNYILSYTIIYSCILSYIIYYDQYHYCYCHQVMLSHFGRFRHHNLDAGEVVVVATVEAATTIDTSKHPRRIGCIGPGVPWVVQPRWEMDRKHVEFP